MRAVMKLGLAALACLAATLFVPTSTRAADVNSLGLSATYDVEAEFSWASGEVAFQTMATVTNPRPWSVSTLAFNLSTLRTGRAELASVTVDGVAVQPVIDDQTVIVPLAASLESGATTAVEFVGTARLNLSPRQGTDEWGFARSDGVMTAYRWIPWLTRTTPFDRPSVGDPFVTASSPRVESRSRPTAPTFATSGEQIAQRRTSARSRPTTCATSTSAPVPTTRWLSDGSASTTIGFYYLTLDPEQVLDVAARAFDHFSERIGAYPYELLMIAEIGPWAPLESPSLFWLPIQRARPLAALDDGARDRPPVVLLGRRQRPGARAVLRRGTDRLRRTRPDLALRAVRSARRASSTGRSTNSLSATRGSSTFRATRSCCATARKSAMRRSGAVWPTTTTNSNSAWAAIVRR